MKSRDLFLSYFYTIEIQKREESASLFFVCVCVFQIIIINITFNVCVLIVSRIREMILFFLLKYFN